MYDYDVLILDLGARTGVCTSAQRVGHSNLIKSITHRSPVNGAWCVFRNYAAHADEIGGEPTESPLFFLKPPSSVVEADSQGNNFVTLLAPSEHIDHEVELAIRLGDDLKPSAMCVAVDTTNRTRQGLAKQKGWPWLEGKGFRGSAVMGTWTRYQAGPFEIGLSLNSELRQCSSTSLMIHDIDSLLTTLNEWYDLSSGDIIFTGTPEGVGPMKPGDDIDAWLKNDDEMLSTLTAVVR